MRPDDAKPEAGRAQVLRILCLDDSYAQLEDLRQSLASGPYQLVLATSLRESIERMQSEKPDLVIIDYHMPDNSGDVCLRALKPLAGTNTRFYLYTYDAQVFRRHREMGFDGVFMLKGKSSVRSQVDAVARAMATFRS